MFNLIASKAARSQNRWLLKTLALALALLIQILILAGTAQAQIGGDAKAKFEKAAEDIAQFCRWAGGISFLMLIPIAAFFYMFGGLSDEQRSRGVRIVTCAIIGAFGLFLFAEPFAQFFLTTFNSGNGSGGGN